MEMFIQKTTAANYEEVIVAKFVIEEERKIQQPHEHNYNMHNLHLLGGL